MFFQVATPAPDPDADEEPESTRARSGTGTAMVPCQPLPMPTPCLPRSGGLPPAKPERKGKKKGKKKQQAEQKSALVKKPPEETVLAKKAPAAGNPDGRSAQSMLRNGYRAQLDLLSLADTKASIMISITGMSASVLVASDMLGLGRTRELMLPSAMLLATFLSALTFAVLAARPPRRSRRDQTAARMEDDSLSILHFANISRLGRDEYVELAAEVMASSERTHRHMFVHLHELGSWLERKFRLLRISYGTFLGGLLLSGVLFLGAGVDPGALMAAARGDGFRPFGAVYEPSAVVSLADGRVLVIEDEAARPMVVLSGAPGGGLAEQALATGDGVPALDDLEGATHRGDFVYAITSHARRRAGQRQASRERLTRFQVSGDGLVDVAVAEGLRQAVLARHPALAAAMESRAQEAGGFNIEGLAFDATAEHLLIGLRSPLMAGDAILLRLEDPDAAFAPEPAWRIAADLVRLDLDGAGIRSIEHIPELDGYLILAGNGGRSEPQRLWFWPGTGAPRPARIDGQDTFRNGEGLARVVVDGEARILVTSDDGNGASGRPGHYLLASLAEVETGVTAGPRPAGPRPAAAGRRR